MPLIATIIGAVIAEVMFDFQLRGWCFIIGLGLLIIGIAGIYDNLFNNRETIWGGKSWGSGFERFKHFLEGIAMIIAGLFLILI